MRGQQVVARESRDSRVKGNRTAEGWRSQQLAAVEGGWGADGQDRPVIRQARISGLALPHHSWHGATPLRQRGREVIRLAADDDLEVAAGAGGGLGDEGP